LTHGRTISELKSIDERRASSTTTTCQSPPPSAMLVRKALANGNKVDIAASICTTFSRDSGIDSMNAANSPGDDLTVCSTHFGLEPGSQKETQLGNF
jgi:hypothetical protein